MKRMIDTKDYENLKKEVNDINDELELKDTDFIITNVVLDDDNNVLGSQVKDVENDVTYNLPLGSQVEANPTLEGTESDLEGIEIDGTKFKVGGGKQLYQHNILVYNSTAKYLTFSLQFISDSNTPITNTTYLGTWLYNNGFYIDDHNDKFMPACGQMDYSAVYYNVNGINYNTYQNQIRWRGFKENAIQTGQIGSGFVVEDTIIAL